MCIRACARARECVSVHMVMDFCVVKWKLLSLNWRENDVVF